MGGCLSVSLSCDQVVNQASQFSVSVSCDQVVNQVSQWLCLRWSYIYNLPENLKSLKNATMALNTKRVDVQEKVNNEESTRRRRRLARVQVWLTSTLAIEDEYNDLDSASKVELQRLRLCGFFSEDLKLSYLYGKRVIEMLREVKDLSSLGEFDVVTEATPIAKVEELPIQPIIVGQETMLEKVWNRLMEDRVRIVGLYGMGGVGKTTLLKQINNKFSEIGGVFEIVIWVLVSKNATVHKIQGGIGEKLGFVAKEWDDKNESQRARDIYNALLGKKFVLLLDDIWEKVSLDVVGVPNPSRENGCKVAFTTRLQEVCGRMRVVDDSIEVRCLKTEKAWELFEKKVGKNTLESHPDIPELARKVAEKCKGLPLALNVIGETMACKRTTREWNHAVLVLNKSATEFSGVVEEILPILKYSYDSLKSEQVKSCFLYCSLFPEDFPIWKEELIEYWIGEGFIDETKGRESALNQGHEIIGTLVRACLLEEQEHYGRMHDVVRAMALWISSDLGKHKERCLVQAGAREMPKVNNRNNVRRMSLIQNEIGKMSESLDCPQLTTLILQVNLKLVTISGEFFRSMPRLLVLDLSDNAKLRGLPEEISGLVSLRYLNLSGTEIERLPVGLQELKVLIYLNLEFTKELESLQGISKLSSLRTLKVRRSKVWLDMSLMEELRLLEHLEFVSINIQPSLVGEGLLNDPRVGGCIQQISIIGDDQEEESVGVLVLPAADNLREVCIEDCGALEIKIEKTPPLLNKSLSNPCFSNLSYVRIIACNGLKDMTWLSFAPNLIHLTFWHLMQLEEIINKEKAASVLDMVEENETCPPFQKLQGLYLWNLPELKSICWNALPFQRLRRLCIDINCPKLRKLPLDSKSVSKVEEFVIEYKEEEWIQGIEWEDKATRLRFLPSLRHT